MAPRERGIAAEARAPLPPPITPSQVLRAALGFKRRTAAAHGLHPRHFAQLAPDGVAAAAALLNVAEAIGSFQPSVSRVSVPLIPKPTTGRRPIGIFATEVRI